MDDVPAEMLNMSFEEGKQDYEEDEDNKSTEDLLQKCKEDETVIDD